MVQVWAITAGGYDYLARGGHVAPRLPPSGEAPGVLGGQRTTRTVLDGVVDADDMAALYGSFIDPRTSPGINCRMVAQWLHAGWRRVACRGEGHNRGQRTSECWSRFDL